MATQQATANQSATTRTDVTDRYTYEWHPFYKCPQEWFRLVVIGGELHKIVHAVTDWDTDKNHRFQPNRNQKRGDIRKTFGVEPVLLPWQKYLGYPFAWNKYSRAKDDKGNDMPEYTIQAHDQQIVTATPFDSQYPLIFGGMDVVSAQRDAKERSRIPTTLSITVRIRMIDPRVAIMENTDWFGQVLTPNLQRALKEFVGPKDYDWLFENAQQEGTKELEDLFNGVGNTPNGGRRINFHNQILEDAGVDVYRIGITDVKPPKAFEEALLAQAVAERTARGKIATAEGEKRAKILQGEAEKEYSRLVGEGNAARIIAEAQADKERIEMTSILTAGRPGELASSLERMRQVRGSGLLVYNEGGAGTMPPIIVNASGHPISS